MNILFMGTPDFAVHSLNALVEAGHNITGVITQPDKPKGRGHKMSHPPVYDYAEQKGLDIYQPATLKNNAIADILAKTEPELIVVVAYGKILPKYVLEYPKHKCVNVHASLLPKYRGAAPIQRAVIDGEKQSGVTTMYMAEGLDTGDMIDKITVEITDNDNYGTLHDKLAIAGGELIVKTVSNIENGTVTAEKQDDKDSTYANMITKDTARINWCDSADNIFNLVRGMYPAPKAFTLFKGKNLKITESHCCGLFSDYKCGEVIRVEKDCFFVSCGNDSVIEITKIQPEGKKEMSVSDYLKGNSISVGDILGE